MTEEVYIVNLLENHKGNSAPRVSGEEYYVDAVVDVQTYDSAGVVLSATDFGLSTISTVMHTGTSNVKFYPTFVISWDGSTNLGGKYTSGKTVTMLIVDNLQSTSAEVGDGGTHSGMQFRLRVYGNL
tara:strand:- start:5090 stop:5470 length:381 start_codon:yes stop_codon:yes gene_type:complete